MRRVSPQEAHDLMLKEGYLYLDVRSVPEYDEGHPGGAYNVPLTHSTSTGVLPNTDFLAVIQRAFPVETRIIVGCRSGSRSLQAAAILAGAGYAHVIDQRGGFCGVPSLLGRGEVGWHSAGLPVETGSGGDRSYAALKARPRSEPPTRGSPERG
jgi:rhodanese-related sulfurtransferase